MVAKLKNVNRTKCNHFLICMSSKIKIFQVHLFKHSELEELQNLSLTDIDYFS